MHRTRRNGRPGLEKHLLMPLPDEKVRALSLEHHLALATVHAGHGNLDHVSCLVRVIYLAFYLQEVTSIGVELDAYRRAELALNACVTRVDRGEHCLLLNQELATVKRILIAHDEQLATITWQAYFDAWERLRHYIAAGKCSPIAAALGH